MQTGRREFAQLSRGESLRLLATVPVGRVVFTIGGLPAVEPVNFLLDDRGIVFRTREGAKLLAARAGTVVAFEVDELEPVARTGWSVTVVGEARVLGDAEAEHYRRALLQPWVNGARDDVVVIDVALVTGRRIEVG